MAGPAQAGEDLPIGQGGKELITLYGGVLGWCFGIDRVDIQPGAAYGKDVFRRRAAGYRREVDVDACPLRLTSGGLRLVLPGVPGDDRR